jgi:hypothetical protein
MSLVSPPSSNGWTIPLKNVKTVKKIMIFVSYKIQLDPEWSWFKIFKNRQNRRADFPLIFIIKKTSPARKNKAHRHRLQV